MRRPKVKTVLICLGLFLLLLIIRFPYGNLKGLIFQRIQKETGLYLAAEDLYLTILGWPGVGMKKVDAIYPLQSSEISVSSERMVFRVGLAGLFPPVPSISISADTLKKGGDLFIKFSQSKTAVRAQVEADRVNLEQFFADKAQAVLGMLLANGSVMLDQRDMSKSSGTIDIQIDKLRTPGQNYQGIIFPSIALGTLKAKMQIRNGNLEINSFQVGGPDSDLQLNITGDIRLGKTLESAFLNLTLKVQMKDSFRDQSASQTLVSLLNGIDNSKPGTYAMKWSTSVEGITTNLLNALPKKVSF